MRPARANTGTNRRTGSFAWLGVVAVLLLQAQLALHPQLDHDAATGVEETCEVCLKLDTSGNAPVTDATRTPIIPALSAEPRGIDVAFPARAIAAYGARAPPVS